MEKHESMGRKGTDMKPSRHETPRRPLMVLTCTIASVLAVIAVAAAAASAATPEYWKGGKPVSSESHIPYTWSGGQLKWATATERWECYSSTGEGEITNSSEGRFTLTLKECKWHPKPEILVSCTSKGQQTGTIATEPLKSHLYYGGEVSVALNDLSPVEGTHVASFVCGTVDSFEWRHSLLGSFEKIKQEASTNSLVLKELEGEQHYKEYETVTSGCAKSGSESDYLESFHVGSSGWSQLGLEAPDTITFKENIEIHAPCIP